MALATTWFWLLAVLWAGFLVLEGFDFGVGVLAGTIGGNEPGRAAATSSIGPLWDANEVWLVVAAAAMFVAFPAWYATMFSALYPVVVVLLVALILRGVSFEFRDGRDSARWRRGWDNTTAVVCVVAPLAVGLLLGNLLGGLPVDPDGAYVGDVGDLLGAYPIYTGLVLVVLCLLHGATFLALKTAGSLRGRAERVARVLAPLALGVLAGFTLWTQLVAGGDGWLAIPEAVGLVGAALAVAVRDAVRPRHRDRYAFGATAVAIASVPVSIFVALHPRVLVSSLGQANDLTVGNASSSSYSLTVSTVVVALLLPLVLAYQAWTYYVFRRRTSRSDAPGSGSGSVDSREDPR